MAKRTPSGGIQMLFSPPTGQAGAYTLSQDDVQIYPAGLTLGASTGFSLDADGNLYSADSYLSSGFDYSGSFPDKTTGTRVYQLGFSVFGAPSGGANTGLEVIFNRLDGSNYWGVAFAYGTSRWYINLYSVVAGSVTNHSVVNGVSLADFPLTGYITVYDSGDGVNAQAVYSESTTDGASGNGDIFAAYSAGSRPLQAEKRFNFRLLAAPGTNVRVKSMMVFDV